MYWFVSAPLQIVSKQYLAKMKSAAIVFYMFQVTFGTLGTIIAYMTLKYFNQKPLGMQTMFDQMIKDKIYLSIVCEVVWVLILNFIVEITMPLDNYGGLLLTFIAQIFITAIIWQITMILVIRYLSVFHHTFLNLVDERLILDITRMFVLSAAVISTVMGDLKNSNLYQLLTDRHIESNDLVLAKPIFIVALISLIILIITQYKIEMYSRTDDNCHSISQLEEGELNIQSGNTNRNYKMNTIRILLGTLCIGFAVVFYFVLSVNSNQDLYLKRLCYVAIGQFLDIIALPSIIIFRNENIYQYFKRQIRSQLPCFSSSAQLLDDGSFAIYALGQAALQPSNAPIIGNQNSGYTADDFIQDVQEFGLPVVLAHPIKECTNDRMKTRYKRRHSM